MDFTTLNKQLNCFTYPTDNLPYVKLSNSKFDESVDNPMCIYIVRGCFTSDSKYGKNCVLVFDDCLVNIPHSFIDIINTIRDNPEMVEAVNKGECKVKIISVNSAKFGKYRTIQFVK